jgi:single-strand DNA-binding protein
MLNRAEIIGRLGRDPDLRYTPQGTTVCNLSIATSEKWQDNAGESQERTEWHKVTAFGKTAENCGQYLAKGSQVYVEGRLQTDKWEDEDGIERYTTKIIASRVLFLSPREEAKKHTYDNFDALEDSVSAKMPF